MSGSTLSEKEEHTESVRPEDVSRPQGVIGKRERSGGEQRRAKRQKVRRELEIPAFSRCWKVEKTSLTLFASLVADPRRTQTLDQGLEKTRVAPTD